MTLLRHCGLEWTRWQRSTPMLGAYVYCHGNPVVRIDPDGRDEYDLNENGNIFARRENNSADIFRFVDKDGKVIDRNLISFKSGTVENVKTQKINDGSMDVYKVRGDDNAIQLYEFVVDGTKEKGIEWSRFETGVAGDKGLNFISTSHEKNTDRSAKIIFLKQLVNGYSIRSHIHNHPSGITVPSGGDIGVYGIMLDKIDENGTINPDFFIYDGKGKYDKYDMD